MSFFILLILQIALTIFWIQILIHCAFNPNLTAQQKKSWLIWLGIFHFISALVYFVKFRVWENNQQQQDEDYQDEQ